MIPLSSWHKFLVFLISFIYLFDIFNLYSHTFSRKEDKKIVSMWGHWSYCLIIFKKIIWNQNVTEVEENWYITDQVILELGTTRRGTNCHSYFWVAISLWNSKHWGKWHAVGDFGHRSTCSGGTNWKITRKTMKTQKNCKFFSGAIYW